jgi:altronate hydrolase
MQHLQLHESDNVAVALCALNKGEVVKVKDQSILILTAVPAGHKFAIRDITVAEPLIKYGVTIGLTTSSIHAGEHVHLHNLKTSLSGIEHYKYLPKVLAEHQHNRELVESTFEGYRRASGVVGTRNEIWVLSTVGCVSKLAERIAQKANQQFEGMCDGVIAFTHPFGCSQTGDDHEHTRCITAALAQHPNAGGVLFVGLGCENNQVNALLAMLPEERLARVRFFNCQQVDNEIEIGVAKISELVNQAKHDKRETCALSELIIGMKCGGSDGYSGLSANPLVGRIADKVCDANGTVLLTEIPEMFGAEKVLMSRAINRDVFNRTVSLINNFKQYYIDNNQNIYENPSPGNKEGGITTLEEKSMGAVQKGGFATVTGVLEYAQRVTKKGLNLLQAPGNDAVSSTALTASGATIILFTTGRGTPLGFPAPTIKISSNSTLAKEKSKWIDFDAGQVFEGNDFDSLSEKLLTHILDVASGRTRTKAEINDQREIAIWKTGVTL